MAVPAAATLFVGDNFECDVGVAQAAGTDAAWIDDRGRGVPEGARRPRYVLRALEDLRAVLEG
jgi:FMN phosphatase YigB (HAD superfamily)